ncbi:MAG: hypothetical protein K0S35_1531, partial [Geminicoccaceae bacterium]|nr:hypothetical protein [Geminicoccaceae bacterium]
MRPRCTPACRWLAWGLALAGALGPLGAAGADLGTPLGYARWAEAALA